MKHSKSLILAAALLLALPTLAAAQTNGLWLHVEVREDGREHVNVNLPLSVAEAAVPMIPQDVLADGGIKIDDDEITVEELRTMWQELQRQPSFTLAEIRGKQGEDVKITKDGGYLHIRVDEPGENAPTKVRVRIPEAVVDALLAGTGNQLDVQGALRALAAHGTGELVTVEEATSRVRVWIDDVAEAR